MNEGEGGGRINLHGFNLDEILDDSVKFHKFLNRKRHPKLRNLFNQPLTQRNNNNKPCVFERRVDYANKSSGNGKNSVNMDISQDNLIAPNAEQYAEVVDNEQLTDNHQDGNTINTNVYNQPTTSDSSLNSPPAPNAQSTPIIMNNMIGLTANNKNSHLAKLFKSPHSLRKTLLRKSTDNKSVETENQNVEHSSMERQKTILNNSNNNQCNNITKNVNQTIVYSRNNSLEQSIDIGHETVRPVSASIQSLSQYQEEIDRNNPYSYKTIHLNNYVSCQQKSVENPKLHQSESGDDVESVDQCDEEDEHNSNDHNSNDLNSIASLLDSRTSNELVEFSPNTVRHTVHAITSYAAIKKKEQSPAPKLSLNINSKRKKNKEHIQEPLSPFQHYKSIVERLQNNAGSQLKDFTATNIDTINNNKQRRTLYNSILNPYEKIDNSTNIMPPPEVINTKPPTSSPTSTSQSASSYKSGHTNLIESLRESIAQSCARQINNTKNTQPIPNEMKCKLRSYKPLVQINSVELSNEINSDNKITELQAKKLHGQRNVTLNNRDLIQHRPSIHEECKKSHNVTVHDAVFVKPTTPFNSQFSRYIEKCANRLKNKIIKRNLDNKTSDHKNDTANKNQEVSKTLLTSDISSEVTPGILQNSHMTSETSYKTAMPQLVAYSSSESDSSDGEQTSKTNFLHKDIQNAPISVNSTNKNNLIKNSIVRLNKIDKADNNRKSIPQQETQQILNISRHLRNRRISNIYNTQLRKAVRKTKNQKKTNEMNDKENINEEIIILSDEIIVPTIQQNNSLETLQSVVEISNEKQSYHHTKDVINKKTSKTKIKSKNPLPKRSIQLRSSKRKNDKQNTIKVVDTSIPPVTTSSTMGIDKIITSTSSSAITSCITTTAAVTITNHMIKSTIENNIPVNANEILNSQVTDVSIIESEPITNNVNLEHNAIRKLKPRSIRTGRNSAQTSSDSGIGDASEKLSPIIDVNDNKSDIERNSVSITRLETLPNIVDVIEENAIEINESTQTNQVKTNGKQQRTKGRRNQIRNNKKRPSTIAEINENENDEVQKQQVNHSNRKRQTNEKSPEIVGRPKRAPHPPVAYWTRQRYPIQRIGYEKITLDYLKKVDRQYKEISSAESTKASHTDKNLLTEESSSSVVANNLDWINSEILGTNLEQIGVQILKQYNYDSLLSKETLIKNSTDHVDVYSYAIDRGLTFSSYIKLKPKSKIRKMKPDKDLDFFTLYGRAYIIINKNVKENLKIGYHTSIKKGEKLQIINESSSICLLLVLKNSLVEDLTDESDMS